MKKFIVLLTAILFSILITWRLLFYNSNESLTIANPDQIKLITSPVPLSIVTSESNLTVSEINLKSQEIFNLNQIQSAISSFTNDKLISLTNEVIKYKLLYQYINEKGIESQSEVNVYVPQKPEVLPIITFGSGTTGIADKCAPSLENVNISNIGNYQNHAISQASQGQIFIFPDYDGYHDQNKNHSYFISEAEAYTTTASLIAVKMAFKDGLIQGQPDFEKIILSGYSQGGHNALATANLLPKLAPEFKVVGIIGYATARNPKALLLDQPELAPYLLTSYQNYYDKYEFKVDEIFLENYRKNISNIVSNQCIDTVYQIYPQNPNQLYSSNFVNALLKNNLIEDFTALDYFLEENTPTPSLQIPIIELQGQADDIVTPQTQLKNIDSLCKAGNQVSYIEVEGVNHFQIRQSTMRQTQDILKKLYDNNFTDNSCK